MALRRENDSLKNELHKLQDFVSQLVSVPETDALMFQKQVSGSEPTSIDPSMMLAQGYHRAEHRLHQPLQLVQSNNTGSETQADLSMHYSKAYPQILAFENPQSIARNLLGPPTPPRLDSIMR